MPILRSGGRNILFIHIPKCGGTTLEHTLAASGIAWSFLDERFGLHDYTPWNRSSPQHLTGQDRERLFASDFFDYEFAVMRDPVRRFLSAFNHHRRTIGTFVSFSGFLDRLERRCREHDDYFGYRFDNHFVPAARFLSDRTEVMLLEDGMDACLATLSSRLGVKLAPVQSDNVRKYDFTHSDVWAKRLIKKAFTSDSPKVSELSADQLVRIRRLYAEDYDRFPGYLADGCGG